MAILIFKFFLFSCYGNFIQFLNCIIFSASDMVFWKAGFWEFQIFFWHFYLLGSHIWQVRCFTTCNVLRIPINLRSYRISGTNKIQTLLAQINNQLSWNFLKKISINRNDIQWIQETFCRCYFLTGQHFWLILVLLDSR